MAGVRRGRRLTCHAGRAGKSGRRWFDSYEVSVPRLLPRLSEWRRETLRTTLWLVPTVQVVLAGVLFLVTFAVDRAAYRGDVSLPGWVDNGTADAARQTLTAIAAAVITVVGLVFSITIG